MHNGLIVFLSDMLGKEKRICTHSVWIQMFMKYSSSRILQITDRKQTIPLT